MLRVARVLLLCAAGCGASTGGYGTPATASATVDWAAQFLGARPGRVVVIRQAVRPDLAARVPDTGAAAVDIGLGSPGTFALEHCAQADVYSQSSVFAQQNPQIVILHGVPAWLDPARPMADMPETTPYSPRFALQSQTRSGTRVYRCTGMCAYQGSVEDIGLFVLPSSTWVFATGVARARLAAAVTGDAPEPPVAQAMAGSIAEAWDVGNAAFIGHDIVGGDQATATGAILFPPAPDGSVTEALGVVFPTEGQARAAAADLANLLAQRATEKVCRSPPDTRWSLTESQAYRDASGTVTQWQSAPSCAVSTVGPILVVSRASALVVVPRR